MDQLISFIRTVNRKKALSTSLCLWLVVLGAFQYGALTARIPAPNNPDSFWLGNLAAPYLLIPFLAGAWMSNLRLAVIASTIGSVSTVAGFYNLHMVGDVTNSQMELSQTVTARDVMIQAYAAWFRNLFLGDPGGIPWLTIAIVTGFVMGFLGYFWRKGIRLSLVVLALAFIVEPLIYVSGTNAIIRGIVYSHEIPNILIWIVEVCAGILFLVFGLRSSKI